MVPTRPVLSGNNCINTHLSEIISELLEPLVLNKQDAEINSTEEFLSKVDELNEEIMNNTELSSNNVLSQFTPYWESPLTPSGGLTKTDTTLTNNTNNEK